MIKKILTVSSSAAIALGFFMSASEVHAYGMAGCGLGSLVIKQNNIMQIFAATTNGTSANQTFGITTGTSNCVPKSDAAFREKQQEVFVSVNYNALEQEMAAGKGEKLEALSGLMGCSDAQAFGAMTRAKYSELFKDDGTPAALLSSMKAEVAKSGSVSCKI